MSDEISALAVPTYVKPRRKAKKWTLEKLAHEAGISTTAVHNLEAGKNGFTDKTLASLARALGCAPAELLTPPDDHGASIRGEDNILAVLNRIEGLNERGVELAFLAITTAMGASSTRQEQPYADDQSAPATPRRESQSSPRR